ncbi:MAG TPA: calcium-binding protein, partial [Allosphingosinicella sp.]|nr:calcium-binding protein [Allosphingosinicella sp.]
TLYGDTDDDIIVGGAGRDKLFGGAGLDVIGGGTGNDSLDGGDGNDQINGGDGNDNFVGGAGDDVIGGGSGDDYIVGEDGSDTIDGGDGHDIVAFRLPEGTPGLLRIVVGTGADEGKLIVERVVDGLVVEQVYRVTVTAESATVEGLGSAAGQGTDVVTNYEQLHFYINGANQHVGINSPFLGTSGADFPGGDWNSDVMFGGDGEDGIFGGAGADIILGEGGDDYYLQGAGGDDYISGGDGHDFINGQAGNDWVKGDSGDDYVNGAGGDDIIDGGEGHDRTGYYHINASLGGVTVSLLLQGQWQDTGIWGQDFLVSIEAVSGTPFGDTLTGDDAGNWLWGSSSFYEPYGPGNGVVQSTTNNDVISGGGGDDLIQVGAGNHTLDGGDGSDWLAYNENGNETVGATVSLALQGQAQDTGVGSWTIGGFENLDGSRVGDHLTGDAGDNILGGGGGDDVLIGGSGNDRLLGDGGAALDTNGYAGPVSYIDDYGNVVGNDTLEGGEGDDTLIGGGGNDVLDGGTGGDHMVGGTGDDVYVVDQYWTETQVGDSVVENADEGVDEVRTWLNWGLGDDNLENLTALGSADLYLGGNALANVITGNAGNNYMVGSGGNDQIEGGDGRDTAAFHLPAGTTGSLRIAEAPDGTLLVQLVQANGTFENMFSVVIEGSGSATVTGLGLAAHLGTDTVTNVEELHFMVDTWPDPTPQDQFTFLSLSVTDFGGYVAGSSADDVIDLADYPGANNVGGGLGDDVITGAVGSSDYMRGDQGNDVITGNGGSDFDVAAYGLPAPMSGTLRVVAGTGADVGKLLVERVDGETVETLFIVSFDEAGTATVVGVNSAAFLGTDTVTGVRSIDFTVDNPEWDPAQFAHILAPASVSDGNDLAGGSNESDFIAAGSGDDQLRGNGGDDVLFGGDGNDLFRGGRGVDYFDGGADYPENSPVNGTFGDRISFFEVAATQGVIADLRTGIISNDGFGNIEAMVGIESLGGDTAFVDTFYGNDNANWLLGSRGDNLYGFGGNDSFQLSAAAAVIDGGEGHDALYLNASGGWLTPDTNGDGFAEGMAAPTAGFTVNLAAGTIGDGYGNNGIITGFEAIYGSHLTDTLIGNFADNSLYGGDGDDTLVGLGGNDVLDGGVGHDFVEGSAGNDIVRGGDGDDYLYGNAGDDLLDGGNGFDRVGYAAGATSGVTVDLNLQGVAQDTGSQGFDTLVGIENVSGTIFNDVLTGDAGDNWLWGGSDGTGVTGDDIISAGAGNDLVDVGNGNHVLDGGDGIDSLGLDGNGTDITEAGVTVSLALQGAAQDTEQGMMTLTGFENLSGSLYDDHLTGDDGDNVLAGYAGADTLVGGKGNDTILGDGLITPDTHGIGRSGPITTLNDVGANADDTLEGGEGDDTLIGGGGNDHLDGGTGNADTALFDLPAAGAGSLSIVDGTGEQAGMKLVVVTDGEASTTLATIAITDGVVTVTGTDAAAALGTDTLTNIDRLVFKAVDGASVELNIGTGVVADGLVAGATVFMDADGDGMLDEGEAFTTTAADGSFSFLSPGSGPIVAIGGVNTDTGLPNLVTLTAPEGSSVVNPITTLINAVIAGGDASSPEEAAQIVASAFGIDGSIDLLNLDLVTAAAEGNQAALDAQKIAVQIVAIMVTASDAGDSESADLALANLASLATETAEGDTLDLADTAVLAEALDGAVPPESIETITEGLSDTLEQIENADSLDELSDVQAQALTTGNDLDNLIVGGAQEDELFGLGGNDILVGGAGADVLNGGAGIDTANYATAPFDVRKQQGVIINLTSGQNKGSDADGDRLIDIENVRGSQFADTLVGNSGANQLWGELGDDSLSGNAGDDTIDGGGGNDQIRGGSGLDSLIGGEGSDLFLFGSADEISIKVGGQWLSDVILDFDAGGESASSSVDRIDLSGLDAISKSKSDDAFSFIGDGAFTGVAGQLHALATGTDEQGRTIYLIEGDMNGDSIADFQLSVHATGILGAGDFIF